MAIDSHMHINSLLTNDINQRIKNINNNPNLEFVINVGLNYETSKESVTISNQNSKFYSSVAFHPLYLTNPNLDDIYHLAQSNPDKIVAIGEIGFDPQTPNHDIQQYYFINQIIIANQLQLPVIIHSNNSNQIIIDIFKKTIKPQYGCVFHCFQPDHETLKYLITNNYFISFAGKITYKNAKKSLEMIKLVPNDLFLVETDSPYISPEPLRNTINQSSNLTYIIQKIAEVKKMDYEEIEYLTTVNTKKLFKKIK